MFMRMLITGLILVLALATLANAQDTTPTVPAGPRPTEIAINESTTLQIMGFGDLLTTFQDNNDGSTFDIGQAEVDLESELTDRFAIALAIAYDEGSFTIGAFTADYNAWSVSESRPSFLGINNFTIGGGQHDVPFGIDWHVYPSIDRKLISSPLVIENTHDSWNDIGGYASTEATWGNVTVFVANGFSYEGTDPSGEELETHNDLAIGGRLGLILNGSFELGGSLARIYGLDQTHDMLLAGVDIQVSIENFKFKGEYIAHRFESDDNSNFTNDGFYLQGFYGIGSWYLIGRYDEFRPDQKSADIARTSTGLGHNINDIIELRLEYQANKEAEDAAIFQVAFGF
ncbi:MAG: hypothetical protein CVT49_12240 [candidate division Zixibacteria bacterium HGW-Zixibacteria-1]|nr:MAG: hypothetical protein CVT49_12240 [candidate division Zixibacteria bacterium HGW-Zixibacteria-1]